MRSSAPAAIALFATLSPTSFQAHAKHIHIVEFKCAGKPDQIKGRKNSTCFACIGGRVTCSRDGNARQWIIDAYEREFAYSVPKPKRGNAN